MVANFKITAMFATINEFKVSSLLGKGHCDGTFSIEIYSNDIDADRDTDNFVQSTITHELGHILCLNDLEDSDGYNNPRTTNSAILMGHGRDRDYIYIPQKGDIDGVNVAY